MFSCDIHRVWQKFEKNLVKMQIHDNNSAKYFKNGRLNKDPLNITLLSSRMLDYIQFPNRGRVRNRTVEKNKDCL